MQPGHFMLTRLKRRKHWRRIYE